MRGTPGSAKRAHHGRIQHPPHQPFVMHVRAGRHDGERHATAIGEEVALHAKLGAVRRIRPRIAPLSAPSPWRCRGHSTGGRARVSSDSTGQAPCGYADPPSGAATPASADGTSSPTRTAWATPSTGSRSAADRCSRPARCDPRCAVGRRGAWPALGATAERSAARGAPAFRRSCCSCPTDDRSPPGVLGRALGVGAGPDSGATHITALA